MNRLFFALALGLACSGCATDVEDAQPAPEEEESQRNPPRPLVGPWVNPYEQMLPPISEVRPVLETPILVAPPFPNPDPNVER